MTEKNNRKDHTAFLQAMAKLLFVSFGCAVMIAAIIMAKLIRVLPKGIDPITIILIVGVSFLLGLMFNEISHASLSIFITIFFSLLLSERIVGLPSSLGIILGEKALFFEIYAFSWLIVNYGILLIIFIPIGCFLGHVIREKLFS